MFKTELDINLMGFPVIRVTRDQSYISDDCFVFMRPIQAILSYSIKTKYLIVYFNTLILL